jgi:hypothetical protein
MPSVSPKQAISMRLAAAGKGNIGIPENVGKDFVAADKSKGNFSKLPKYKGKNHLAHIMK